ncbi:MAG: hypothetical protein B7Y88_14775 [Sphingomonadales bacterium 32-64-17]|nr:MAG: hypothetical protein B7Y88_14775 [Sphingomonadales bacterium 32-64-17]
MAKIRIPCLVGKTNKAGVTNWYWQPSKTLREAGFDALSLGRDEGVALVAARKRNAEVELWKAGDKVKSVTVIERKPVGTLGALIERYRREVINGKKPSGQPRIAASTAKTYGTALKRLEAWAGKHPIAFVTPARVRVLRDKMLATVGEHAAHQTLKMGRTLFAQAIAWDLLPPGANPFQNFGLATPAARQVVWSPAARELIIATAHKHGQPSIALGIQLGFAIGQREADLLKLTAQHFVAIPEHKMQPEDFATLAALSPDGVPRGIRVRQGKTQAWIEVPVIGEVREAIEANIATARAVDRLNILLDDTRLEGDRVAVYAGKAGQTRFQRDFARVRELAAAEARKALDEDLAAEIEGLWFMDLRRTCVVYLGELGLDAHLIAAITGHDIDETQRILKTYMPRTTGRAARAIALSSMRDQGQRDVASGANDG